MRGCLEKPRREHSQFDRSALRVNDQARRGARRPSRGTRTISATSHWGEFFGDEDLYVMNRQGHKEP